MKTTEIVPVHTLWQGTMDVHAARCGLRITNPIPTYFFQQHGETKVSRKPLLRVEFRCNEGCLTGVANCRDLRSAGIKLPAYSTLLVCLVGIPLQHVPE